MSYPRQGDIHKGIVRKVIYINIARVTPAGMTPMSPMTSGKRTPFSLPSGRPQRRPNRAALFSAGDSSLGILVRLSFFEPFALSSPIASRCRIHP